MTMSAGRIRAFDREHYRICIGGVESCLLALDRSFNSPVPACHPSAHPGRWLDAMDPTRHSLLHLALGDPPSAPAHSAISLSSSCSYIYPCFFCSWLLFLHYLWPIAASKVARPGEAELYPWKLAQGCRHLEEILTQLHPLRRDRLPLAVACVDVGWFGFPSDGTWQSARR
jgi:hypothetical protein